jgi:hypothetical protein
MGYCNQPGCLTKIDNDQQQSRHDEIFPENCAECECFSRKTRRHMLEKCHLVCGFGACSGQGVRTKSDAAVRRYWNEYHRGDQDKILVGRFGDALYDDSDDEDGYYSEAA